MKVCHIEDKRITMKRFVVIGIVVMLLLILNACGKIPGISYEKSENLSDIEYLDDTNTKGEEDMKLTDRQLGILKQQGLSTVYEELNDGQKKSIVAIEEMFCYLDNKYEVEFEFLGYKAETTLDKESLIVKIADGTSADVVTVVRENGVCSDNYATVYYREGYENEIKKYFEGSFDCVQVYSDIAEVEESCSEDNLVGCVRATSGVYVSKTAAQGKTLSAIAKEFGDWYISNNGKSSSLTIYVVEDSAFLSVTRFNRTDYDDNVVERINVIIRADGSVIVR